MPYIVSEHREKLDPAIEELIRKARDLTPSEWRRGIINYMVSRIALGTTGNHIEGLPTTYHAISDAIAALRDAADEIARRVMGPRENVTILNNGDLKEYLVDARRRP